MEDLVSYLDLPSGLKPALQEVIFEPKGVPTSLAKSMRLRFVAPEIVDTNAYSIFDIEADFLVLCEVIGLARRAEMAPNVDNIIVSISAEPTIFGESQPNVVQYFDAYSVVDNSCIWDGF